MSTSTNFRTALDHPVIFGTGGLVIGGLALMWLASKWTTLALWLFLKWTALATWIMFKWTIIVPVVAVTQLLARRARDRQDAPSVQSDFPPSDRVAHLW